MEKNCVVYCNSLLLKKLNWACWGGSLFLTSMSISKVVVDMRKHFFLKTEMMIISNANQFTELGLLWGAVDVDSNMHFMKFDPLKIICRNSYAFYVILLLFMIIAKKWHWFRSALVFFLFFFLTKFIVDRKKINWMFNISNSIQLCKIILLKCWLRALAA